MLSPAACLAVRKTGRVVSALLGPAVGLCTVRGASQRRQCAFRINHAPNRTQLTAIVAADLGDGTRGRRSGVGVNEQGVPRAGARPHRRPSGPDQKADRSAACSGDPSREGRQVSGGTPSPPVVRRLAGTSARQADTLAGSTVCPHRDVAPSTLRGPSWSSREGRLPSGAARGQAARRVVRAIQLPDGVDGSSASVLWKCRVP